MDKLGMYRGGLAIWHRLTLESIASAHVSSATRILIAFMFGLIPMAVSQGDALRWYPVLAFMSAVTFFAYLLGGRRWYLCGIPLGLAADTESLAILLFLAIAVERWAFQRRFEWREDVTFAALTGIIALPSVITFVNILRFHPVSQQLTPRNRPAHLRFRLRILWRGHLRTFASLGGAVRIDRDGLFRLLRDRFC